MNSRNQELTFVDQLGYDPRPGGFPPNDGTIDFYLRVRSLLPAGGSVLDLGAGRGAWMEDPSPTRRRMRDLSDLAGAIIGVDVDPAIRQNPQLDEAFVLGPSDPLPLAPSSVDLVLADFVFEHIANPRFLATELARVLRPGGWCCARTPNKFGYIATLARLIPNPFHTSVLKRVQPGRQRRDVFPTLYRLNTLSTIRRHFQPEFADYSFPFWSNLHYGQHLAFARLLEHLNRALLPERAAPMLFVFLQRSP